MFETSKDILNIVIAVSIFGIAFFLCWGMYYLNMSLRQIFKAVREMRDRFHKIDELTDAIKEKIDHSASYLFLIGEGVKKLVEVIGRYTEKKESDEEISDKK
jgi:hypothetical protein